MTLPRNKFKLSEADAKEFVQTIDEVVLEDIKQHTGEYKSIMKEDILALDNRLSKEMSSIEMGLLKEIKDSKVDMIK